MKYDADKIYRLSKLTPDWCVTAGVMHMCETLECYWILDVIVSYVPNFKNADYLKIITVNLKDKGCTFKIVDEINGELIRQEIEYTELKTSLKWWAITSGELTVVMLPSEY